MSVSSEVQRTLVKSPPELWAELSDPAALARHLCELGEIQITRVEPEKSVEWEATDASGAVRLKPSGWGTKVTLTVTRKVPAPEPAPAPEPIPELLVEPEPIAASEPEPAAEPEPAPVQEPEPRRGFFARLFGRRPKVEPEAEAAPEPTVEPVPEPEAAVDAGTEANLEPEPEIQEEAQPDLAAELAALEESLVAETQAVLTTVLDRLGAAHHRPFSRS